MFCKDLLDILRQWILCYRLRWNLSVLVEMVLVETGQRT